jgi:hypothetical protein
MPGKTPAEYLLLLLFFTVPFLSASFHLQQSKSISRTANDRVVIRPRTVVLIRPAKLAKEFPERKTATVTYPIVSGLSNVQILRRVQSILSVKNVFDYSLNEYRQDSWLTEFTYQTNYNANYILDISFTQSGMAAYPDTQTKHFAIDLKTGAVIKPGDVFLDAKLGSLAGIVDTKLQAELGQITRTIKTSSELESNQGNSIVEAFAELKFEAANLNEFEVGRKGITFLYDAGFPHVIRAFEPRGRYFFTYSEMKPYIKREGMLGQFVNWG